MCSKSKKFKILAGLLAIGCVCQLDNSASATVQPINDGRYQAIYTEDGSGGQVWDPNAGEWIPPHNGYHGHYTGAYVPDPNPPEVNKTQRFFGSNSTKYILRQVEYYDEVKQEKVTRLYWVQEYYTLEVESGKNFDGANSSLNIIVKSNSGDEYSVGRKINHITDSTDTLVNNNKLHKLSIGGYSYVSNSGNTVPTINSNFYILKNGHWINVGKDKFKDNFKEVVNPRPGVYEYKGKRVSPDSIYFIKDSEDKDAKGTLGVFIEDLESDKIYTGSIYDDYNHVLIGGESSTGWGNKSCFYGNMNQVSIESFNSILESIHNEDVLLSENDIKSIIIENKDTIHLIRLDGSKVGDVYGKDALGNPVLETPAHGIVIKSIGGIDGNDTKVTINDGTGTITLNTGSKVEAIGPSNQITGLKINGQDYSLGGIGSTNLSASGNIILTGSGKTDDPYNIALANKVTLGSDATIVEVDGTTGNIKAGKVSINGMAGTVNGLTNKNWNGKAVVGQAATEDQLKIVDDKAIANTGKISEVEGKVGGLTGRVGTIESDINSIGEKITTVKGELEANINTAKEELAGDITSVDSKVTGLNERVGIVEGNITNLDERVTTIKSELGSQITTTKGDLTSDITAVDSKVTGLGERVGAAESSIANLNKSQITGGSVDYTTGKLTLTRTDLSVLEISGLRDTALDESNSKVEFTGGKLNITVKDTLGKTVSGSADIGAYVKANAADATYEGQTTIKQKIADISVEAGKKTKVENADSNITVSGDGVTSPYKVGLADKVSLGSGETAVEVDGTNGKVKVGKVSVNGAAATVNGLTNKTWNGKAVVGQAATEDQLKIVDDKVIVNTGKISEVEGKVGGLTGRVETVEGNVTAFGEKITTVKGELVGQINTAKDELTGKIGTVDDKVTGLSERVGAVEGNLTTSKEELTGKITAVDGKVTGLGVRVDATESSIATLNKNQITGGHADYVTGKLTLNRADAPALEISGLRDTVLDEVNSKVEFTGGKLNITVKDTLGKTVSGSADIGAYIKANAADATYEGETTIKQKIADLSVAAGEKTKVENADSNITISGDGVSGPYKVGLADKVTLGSDETVIEVDGTTGNVKAGKVSVDGTAGTVNGLTNKTWNGKAVVGQAATEDQLKIVDDKVVTNTGKISAVEGKVVGLTGRVETVESDVTSLGEKITTVRGELVGQVNTAKGELGTQINTAKEELSGQINTTKEDLTSKIGVVDDKVTRLSGRVETAEGNITTLDERVTTVKGELSGQINTAKTELGSRITTTKEELSGKIDTAKEELAGKIGTVDGKVTGVTERIGTVEGNLTTLDERVTTVKGELDGKIIAARNDLTGNITTAKEELSGKIGTVDGKVRELSERVGTVEGNLTTLDERVTTVKGELSGQINTAKTELGSQITTVKGELTGKITVVDGKVTGLGGRVDAAESGIATLNKNQIIGGSADYITGKLTLNRADAPALEITGLRDTVIDESNSKVEFSGGKLNVTVKDTLGKTVSGSVDIGSYVKANAVDATYEGQTTIKQKIADISVEASKKTKVENSDSNITISGDGVTSPYIVGLADKVTLGSGETVIEVDGTTGNVKAGKVSVDGTAGTVNGLTNKTWNGKAVVGQAATEDQLKIVDDKVIANTGKISEVEGKLGGLTSRIEAVESGVTSLDEKITTVKGELDGRITTTEEELTGKIGTVDDKVTGLSGRVGTVEGNLTTLDDRVTTVKGELTGQINTAKTELGSQITTAKEELTGEITAVDGKVTGLGGRVDAAESGIVALNKNQITGGHADYVTGKLTLNRADAPALEISGLRDTVLDEVNSKVEFTGGKLNVTVKDTLGKTVSGSADIGSYLKANAVDATYEGQTTIKQKIADISVEAGKKAKVENADSNITISGDGVTSPYKVGLADKVSLGSSETVIEVDGTTGNVKAGKVSVDGTAGTVNGLTNKTWNGKAVVGQAATEDQLKIVDDKAIANTGKISAVEGKVGGLTGRVEAVESGVTSLDEKITTVKGELDGRITTTKEELGGQINTAKEEMTGKIGIVDDKVTGLFGRVGTVEGNLTTLDERVTTVKGELSGQINTAKTELGSQITTVKGELTGKITAVDGKVTGLGGRVDAAESGIATLNKNQIIGGSADYITGKLTLNRVDAPALEISGLRDTVLDESNSKVEFTGGKLNITVKDTLGKTVSGTVDIGSYVKANAADAIYSGDITIKEKLDSIASAEAEKSVVKNGDANIIVDGVGSAADPYKVSFADKISLGSGETLVEVDGTTGNIKAGKVSVNGTAGTVNGLTNKTWNGKAVVGQAATEDQLKIVDDKVIANTGKISAVEGKVGGLTGCVDTVESNVTALGEKITTVKGELDGRITTTKEELSSQINTAKEELTGKIGTVDGKVTGLSERVGTVEGNLTTLDERVTTVKGELTGQINTVKTELGSRITTIKEELNGQIDTAKEELTGKIGTVDGKVTGLTERVGTVEGNLTTLDERVTTVKGELDGKIIAAKNDLTGNITTAKEELTGKIGTVDSKVTGLSERVGTVESNFTTLDERVTTVKGELSSQIDTAKEELTGKIGTVDGKVTGLSGRVGTVEGNLTTLDERVTTVKGELSGQINTVKTELGSQIATTEEELTGKITAVDSKVTGLGGRVGATESGITTLNKNQITGGHADYTTGKLTLNRADAPALEISGLRDTVIDESNSKIEFTGGKLNVTVKDTSGKTVSGSVDIGSYVKANAADAIYSGDITIKEKLDSIASAEAEKSVVKNGDANIIVNGVGSAEDPYKVSLADKVNFGSGATLIEVDGTTGDIKVGKVNVNGTAGTVNGLTNKTWNGKAVVGQAATEDQLKIVDDKAIANTGKISTVEGKVGGLNGRVETVEGNLTTLDERVTTVKGELTGQINTAKTELGSRITTTKEELNDQIDAVKEELTGKIGTVDGKVTGLTEWVGTVEGNLTTLDERVTTVKGELDGKIIAAKNDLTGNITTAKEELTGKIGTVDGKVTGLSERIGTVESNFTTLDERVTTVKGELSGQIDTAKEELTGKIGTVDGKVTGLSGRVETVEGSLTTLDERVTAVKGELVGQISTAKTELGSKITATEEELTGKITVVDGKVTGLGGRVDAAESGIATLNKNQITGGSADYVTGKLTLNRADAPALEISGLRDTVLDESNSKVDFNGGKLNITVKDTLGKTVSGTVDIGSYVKANAADAIYSGDITIKEKLDSIASAEAEKSVVKNGDANVIVDGVGSADDPYEVSLADKISLGSGEALVEVDGTTGNIKAGKVSVDGTAGTVNGLTNKTWNGKAVVGQAATEDQLKIVDDKVIANTGKISEVEGKVGSLTGRVDTVESSVTSLGEKIITVKGELVGQVNAAKGELGSQITTAKEEFSGQINTTKENLTSKIGVVDDKVTGISGRVGTVEGNLTTLDEKVTTVKGELSSQINTAKTELSSKITTTEEGLTGKITAVEGKVTGLGGRVDIAESGIATLNKNQITGGSADYVTGKLTLNRADAPALEISGLRDTVLDESNSKVEFTGGKLNVTVKDTLGKTVSGSVDIGSYVKANAADAIYSGDITIKEKLDSIASAEAEKSVVKNGDANVIVDGVGSADDPYKVSLADKISLGSGETLVEVDGTTGNVKAGKVSVDGTAGTVNGLTNKTWNGKAVVGQAATEDQLKIVDDKVIANTGKVSAVEGKVGGLTGRVETVESNVTALGEKITTVKGELDGRITTTGEELSSQINTAKEELTGKIGTVDSKVTGLSERVGTVEGNLTTLDERVTNAEKVFGSDITAVGSRITTLDNRVGVAETGISSLNKTQITGGNVDYTTGKFTLTRTEAPAIMINGLRDTTLDKSNSKVEFIDGKLNITVKDTLGNMLTGSTDIGDYVRANAADAIYSGNITIKEKLDSIVSEGIGKTVVKTGDKNIIVTGEGTDSNPYQVGLSDEVILGNDNNAVHINGKKGVISVGKSGPSMSVNGINAANKVISNVAAGIATTDAVNVGQLEKAIENFKNTTIVNDQHIMSGDYAVKDNQVSMNVVDGKNNILGNVTITGVASSKDMDDLNAKIGNFGDLNDGVQGSSIIDSLNKVDNRLDNVENDITNIKDSISNISNEASKHSTITNRDGNIVVKETVNDAGGKNFDVSLDSDIEVDNSISVGGKDGVLITGSAITGLGNTEWDMKGDYSGSGNAATEAQLSKVADTKLGYDIDDKGDVDKTKITLAGGKDKDGNNIGTTITNLAAGKVDKDSTEAVNGSQLYATNQAVINNSQNIQNISSGLSMVNSRVDKVGAGAAALAALHPLEFDPDDKLSFSAGVGRYSGATATSIGAYYRPTDKVLMSVAGTYGNGENMMNMGVTFSLDKNNGMGNSRAYLAKELSTMRAQMAKQDEQIANQNQQLDKQDRQIISQTRQIAIQSRQIVNQSQQITQLMNLVSQLTGKEVPVESESNINTLYADTEENHWVYSYLNELANEGILKGYQSGIFGKDNPLTRYQIAKLLDSLVQEGIIINDSVALEFAVEFSYINTEKK